MRELCYQGTGLYRLSELSTEVSSRSGTAYLSELQRHPTFQLLLRELTGRLPPSFSAPAQPTPTPCTPGEDAMLEVVHMLRCQAPAHAYVSSCFCVSVLLQAPSVASGSRDTSTTFTRHMSDSRPLPPTSSPT